MKNNLFKFELVWYNTFEMCVDCVVSVSKIHRNFTQISNLRCIIYM